MQSAYDGIIRPVVSERSYDLMEQGKYTFEVARTAPKEEIAAAVEKLFNVHVVKVNTINVRGRYRRQGMHAGYTAKSKKAIVTLKQDSKGIDFFESMV